LRKLLGQHDPMTRLPGNPDSAQEHAAQIGEALRQAREHLGWNLPEIAAGLRIRLAYLEALEEGRLQDLPGTTYALGFLRSYARILGLDGEALARRFKEAAGQAARKPELIFPAPPKERGVPAGAAAFVGVLLVAAAYAGWYRLSGEGRVPAETVPAVPERLASLSPQPTQPATPAQPSQVQTQPAAPAAAPVPAPAAPKQAAEEGPSGSPASATAMPTPPASTPDKKPDEGRIILRARSDSWVQVREKGGALLLNRILHGGETWAVPDKPALLLTTGNAGGTELVVDGVVTPSLGSAGSVRRDIPLDPETIKAGKLAAQLQTDQLQAAASQTKNATQPGQNKPTVVQPSPQ